MPVGTEQNGAVSGMDDSELAVLGHVMANQLAAVSAASSMLQRPEFAEQREMLRGVVEAGTDRLHAALGLLQRGLPGVALAELTEQRIPKGGTTAPHVYPKPDDDEERVAALRRYQLLDQAPMRELETVARLAAGVAGAAGAVINLIDADRQWPAAAWGLERVEVPRHDAMCNTTVASRAAVFVSDASADPTYADSPWVTGVLGNVRLYVSIPLLAEEQHAVGTLCIVDEEVTQLSPDDLRCLSDLAHVAITLMEGRLATLELRRLLGLET
jgi:hypothetical protein